MRRGYFILFILLCLKGHTQHYDLGMYYFEMKDYNNAILNFTLSIDNNINLKNALHQRGRTYYRKGEFYKASIDADICCNDYNFCILKEYMLKNGLYNSRYLPPVINEAHQDTIIVAQNTEQNNNQEEENFYEKAMDYMKNEDYRNAVIFFTKEIEQSPNHIRSYIERGKIYTLYEKYDKAKLDAKKACDLGDCSLWDMIK